MTDDPTKAKKRKQSQEKASLRKPIATDAFRDVATKLRSTLIIQLNLANIAAFNLGIPDLKGNMGRVDCIIKIRQLLCLIEKMYGEGAFRCLACWQDFARDWCKLQGPTEKALASVIKDMAGPQSHNRYYLEPDHWVRTLVNDFVAFMAKECKRQMPAVGDLETPVPGIGLVLGGTTNRSRSSGTDGG